MFSSLVKYRIRSDVKSSLIITIQLHLLNTNSKVTRAIVLYSASALDGTTTLSFLLFQETVFPPKDT